MAHMQFQEGHVRPIPGLTMGSDRKVCFLLYLLVNDFSGPVQLVGETLEVYDRIYVVQAFRLLIMIGFPFREWYADKSSKSNFPMGCTIYLILSTSGCWIFRT